MNKAALIAAIQNQLAKELAIVLQSAQAALDGATHEENKAENKYDTRGLESAYLAEAQSKRASQIQETILYFTHLKPQSFDNRSPINLTAFIQLTCNQKMSSFFLTFRGGGMNIHFKNQDIQVLGAKSPLAENLVGRKHGDIFEINTKGGLKEYEIVRVE